MLKNIIYRPTQKVYSLPRGTKESLTTRINNFITDWVKEHYLPKDGATRELAQKVVGLYLLHVEEMGNYEARKFVRNHFAIGE